MPTDGQIFRIQHTTKALYKGIFSKCQLANEARFLQHKRDSRRSVL
jgi:hypothetical protein